MALAVLAQGLMTFWNTAFVALRRVSLTLRVVVYESLAEVTASVALVALGAGATGAAFGRAVGFGFGALVALILIHRLLGSGAITVFGGGHGRARQIARYAGVMLVVETAYSAWSSVNGLIIGWLLGATAVGLFAAPFRLVGALTYAGIAVAQAVAPRMSRAGQGPDVRSFASATRFLIMLQLAFAIPIAVWAAPITNLVLGDAYDESVGVMRTLALFAFIAGFSPLFSVSVNYLGEARWRVPIVLAGFSLNVLLDFALVGKMGIEGAALGATAGSALYTGAHLWICTRAADVGLPLRRLGATLLRSLAAGALMAAVLLAFGTSSLGLATMITGGLAAVAVYVGALLLLGELSRGELKRVRAQVARLAGSR
jgi:O-antigen/teichoic acid export membrane protein